MSKTTSPQPASSVYVYCRVSTEDQATDGVSLDMQQARARAWAESNGYSVAGVFTDAGISGKRADNRPELQRLLGSVSAGSVLVVYSLSRLSRSTKDMLSISERLTKTGAELVSLSERIDTTGATGKMVFRLLAVLGEFERDLISERVTAAIRHKRQHGEVFNHVPFGYERDGERLVSNSSEQAARAAMIQMRADGYSLRQIAAQLTADGVSTKRGGRWQANTIRKVLAAAAG